MGVTLRELIAVADWKIAYKLNAIVALTALSSLIFALIGIVTHDHAVKKEILAQEIYILTAITAQRSSAALQFFDEKAARENLELLKIRSIITNACIFNADGTVFTSVSNNTRFFNSSDSENQIKCTDQITSSGVYFGQNDISVVVEIKSQNNIVGHIYVRASLEELKNQLNRSIVISALIFISAFLGTLLISIPFQQRLVMPLIILRDLAIKVSKNRDFSVRAEISQKDEIGDTADAFNLMLSTIEKSNEELFRLAYFDQMTGLGNRQNFLKALEVALVKTRYSNKLFAVIIVNIDHIRGINTDQGHNYGDLVLIEVADRLKDILPESAEAYRLGGDEFIIIGYDFENIESAKALLDSIHHELKKPMHLDSELLQITVSSGVALSSGFDTCFTMMKRADLALNEAKVAGLDSYRFSGNYLLGND